MSMIEQVWEKARRDQKTIVLPEGEELRTVQAAGRVAREGIANPVLLGDPEQIRDTAEKTGTDLSSIMCVDPARSAKAKGYAELLYELRRTKGLTREEAGRLALDPMYYGMLMVKAGDADGLVSGAVHTTGDMLRPALQIIKTKPGIHIVSSSFLMNCPNPELGQNGLLVYADCVVVPCPSAEELAQIAVSAAETARVLCGIEEPRVAMLSFSTKGSAKRANVLIFPDLQSGNIGYKITQRIGNAECYAVLQGLARPCNDLSRGCSVQDIVNTIALTAVQAH